MDRKNYFTIKIEVPPVSHNLLPRKDIAAILNREALDMAACFVAPYGYGKTMAVASWLRDSGKSAVWITLDADDNSELVFLAGLSAAMMRVTGWQGDVNGVLSDPEYINSPLEYLWARISDVEKSACDNIIVIDNLQFIRDRMLSRQIKDLISELLGRWRVILMSRTELPAVFTELILKGHVYLVTPEELSFSIKEAEDFFNANDCVCSQEEIAGIIDETEGWPSALNVVLTISRGRSILYGEAARSYLNVFFETEVWDSLENGTKDFLLKTSIIDQLTPPACRAVTELSSALSVLRWLFANGLFISKLDERDSYHYHRVFQDFLLDKLASSPIDERELYKKLGWWFYDNNKIEQAFPLLFKAGDLYGVTLLLKGIYSLNLALDALLELIGCITTLDVKDLKLYPVIVAHMALVEFLNGNLSKMHELIRVYEEYNDADKLSHSPEEYAEYLWESRWLSFVDPDEPSRANPKHIEYANYRYYVPHLKEVHLKRSAFHVFPSFFRGIRDYGDDGIFDTEEILARIEQGDSFIGEEENVWKTRLIIAEYKYEIEDFAWVEENIGRVMPLIKDRRLTESYFCCTYLLVKLMRALHRAGEIHALITGLESVIADSGHIFLLPNFHAFEQRNRLAAGQAGFTEAFERENKANGDKPYFYLHYRHLTLARVHLSLGEYARALVILGNLELLYKKYKRPTDLIEVRILQAIVCYCLGNESTACQYLLDAIESAKKYGYIRIFSDDAGDLWPVLELIRKRTKDKYIQSIVISCKKALASSGRKLSSKPYAHTELTKTERRILKSLPSNMSYEEIAQDNNIRVSTVKSHLQSIYSKLAVNNRTAAVIAARERGILD